MLQGMEPERGVKTGLVVSVDSEDAAFFTGFVIVMIEMDHMNPEPPSGMTGS